MRFLMLIHEVEGVTTAPPPQALLQAVDAYRAEAGTGRIVDDGGLMPPAQAVSVRSARGNVIVTDGPFAEAREIVGGFFVVESESPAHMTRWAQGFVELHAEHWPEAEFAAEIRQIAEM